MLPALKQKHLSQCEELETGCPWGGDGRGGWVAGDNCIHLSNLRSVSPLQMTTSYGAAADSGIVSNVISPCCWITVLEIGNGERRRGQTAQVCSLTHGCLKARHRENSREVTDKAIYTGGGRPGKKKKDPKAVEGIRDFLKWCFKINDKTEAWSRYHIFRLWNEEKKKKKLPRS